MDFSGKTRDQVADMVACTLKTPSQEQKAKSIRAGFKPGYDVAAEGIKACELVAMQAVYAFCVENSYTGPTPDFEALLPE